MHRLLQSIFRNSVWFISPHTSQCLHDGVGFAERKWNLFSFGISCDFGSHLGIFQNPQAFFTTDQQVSRHHALNPQTEVGVKNQDFLFQ